MTTPPAADRKVATDYDARYAELQQRLVPLWQSIRDMSQEEQTIVVVPSISVDAELDGSLMQAYEERFLFLLLLLRQARAHVVYVTSQEVPADVVDYYVDLLPGVIASHGKRRLHMIAPRDGSARSLAEKLLGRPHLLRRIRGLIADPHRAHLVAYNTTEAERDLALALGIPLYGSDPKHDHFGTKSGCRKLFREEGVAHPLGVEGLHSLDDLVKALVGMRRERPEMRRAIVKLNEGVSGEGNATVDLEGVPAPGEEGEANEIRARLEAMRFELATQALDEYLDKLDERGGVVEERLSGVEFRSPSAQLRITPLGEVQLLSTHDQLLGGPSGQSYLGCKFPADAEYAAAIAAEAMKVGRRLAKEGVLGRFAIDFVTVREQGGPWSAYAIEINLRKGGTTHPFLTLQFLTDGSYDAETGVFTAPDGIAKHFVASDHVESEAYRAFTAEDLFDIVSRHGLHYDQARQTGIVFHMLAALGEHGRFGLTAVADSAADAQALYERAIATFDEEARAALAE
ncbi:MAG: hypothetical protein KDB94_06705 [Acidobacteria bacterium]|nr:hypothetical protein [Acidobacteriota bacterium]